MRRARAEHEPSNDHPKPRTTHAAAAAAAPGKLQHWKGKESLRSNLMGGWLELAVGRREKKRKSGFDVTGVGPSNQDQAGRTRPHLIVTRTRKEPGRGWVVLASTVHSPQSIHLSSPQLTSITFSGRSLSALFSLCVSLTILIRITSAPFSIPITSKKRKKKRGHPILHPIGRANANALLSKYQSGTRQLRIPTA